MINTKSFKIVLTEDNPNNVKIVFNSLLQELKKNKFKFEDTIEDLFHHICKEYLSQLNNELLSVYQELLDLE